MAASAATSKDNAQKVLAGCSLFRGLSAPVIAALVARAHIRSFSKGDVIFTMGSEGDCLMAVLSGTVRIEIASIAGRDMLLALLNAGEIFGEIAVLDGRERTADAVAHTACTLAVLDRRDILAMLEREPAAWLSIVEILCGRLRNTDQQIVEVAFLDLPARLASALLRISQRPDDTEALAPVTLSQRALGEMVGASRESVNKCLSQWQRARLIRIQGADIRIMNRDALEQIAEGD